MHLLKDVRAKARITENLLYTLKIYRPNTGYGAFFLFHENIYRQSVFNPYCYDFITIFLFPFFRRQACKSFNYHSSLTMNCELPSISICYLGNNFTLLDECEWAMCSNNDKINRMRNYLHSTEIFWFIAQYLIKSFELHPKI